jgi:putative aminopeptidase FrvX
MMILKQLSEAIGVSGDEGAIRQIILEAIQDHVTDITVDSMGNITAFKEGTGKPDANGKRSRVMLDAHMDEVGFMVTGHDSNGLLRFTNVGGIDDRILPGLRVRVGEKAIPGVILWTPIHFNREQNVVKMKNLRIDIGATSKSQAEGMAKTGTRLTFDSEFTEFEGGMMRGKAFDDRVGCSVLVDVLQGGDYPVDIVASFSVQEEVGLRGAKVASQRLLPDVAIALEGTTAHDLPNPLADPDDPTRTNPACVIGKGPVLTVMDRSMITPPQLVRFIRKTADDNDIPYQLKTALGGGTDAGAIHQTNGGVPSAVISMPCRYIHAPRAMMHRDDYDNDVKLVQAILNNITRDAIQPL